jgi:hypothetical protein
LAAPLATVELPGAGVEPSLLATVTEIALPLQAVLMLVTLTAVTL